MTGRNGYGGTKAVHSALTHHLAVPVGAEPSIPKAQAPPRPSHLARTGLIALQF